MTIFDYLNLRSEFEELTLNMRVPGERKPGTVRNMKWFLKNGVDRNRKFDGVERAAEIAELVSNAA